MQFFSRKLVPAKMNLLKVSVIIRHWQRVLTRISVKLLKIYIDTDKILTNNTGISDIRDLVFHAIKLNESYPHFKNITNLIDVKHLKFLFTFET